MHDWKCFHRATQNGIHRLAVTPARKHFGGGAKVKPYPRSDMLSHALSPLSEPSSSSDGAAPATTGFHTSQAGLTCGDPVPCTSCVESGFQRPCSSHTDTNNSSAPEISPLIQTSTPQGASLESKTPSQFHPSAFAGPIAGVGEPKPAVKSPTMDWNAMVGSSSYSVGNVPPPAVRGGKDFVVGVHTPWKPASGSLAAAPDDITDKSAYFASNMPDPLFNRCMELSLWTSPIPGVRITHDSVGKRRRVFANKAAYALFGATERFAIDMVKGRHSLIWLHPEFATARWVDHLRAIADHKRSHRYRGVYLRHCPPDSCSPADSLSASTAIYPFTAEERVSFDYFPNGICSTVTVFFTNVTLIATPLPAETARVLRREAMYGRLKGQDSPSCFYCNSRRCRAGDPNLCCPLVLEELTPDADITTSVVPPPSGLVSMPPTAGHTTPVSSLAKLSPSIAGSTSSTDASKGPSTASFDAAHDVQVAALLGELPARTTAVGLPSARYPVAQMAVVVPGPPVSHRDPITVTEPVPSQADGTWSYNSDPFAMPQIPDECAVPDDGFLSRTLSPMTAPAFGVSYDVRQQVLNSSAVANGQPPPQSPWWDAVMHGEPGLPELPDSDMDRP